MSSMLLHLALLASIGSSQARSTLDLVPRSSDSCPASYQSCGNTALPDGFCCSESSTCISLDNASSIICCPIGENCDYILPIQCDIELQNATLNSSSIIKTTRLGDTLAKCGDDTCCPFGYNCQGDTTCALDKATAVTAIPSEVMRSIIETSSSTKITATTPQELATITMVPSPSSKSSVSSIATTTTIPLATITPGIPSSDEGSTNVAATNAPTYPSEHPAKAIAVGFFPGAIFGAIAALLVSLWARRRTNEDTTQIQEPTTRSQTPTTSYQGPHEMNAVPSEVRHELDGVPPGDTALMHNNSSRMRNLFSGHSRPNSRMERSSTPASITAPVTSNISRPHTTLSDLVHARHEPDEKQNPFRDPEPR